MRTGPSGNSQFHNFAPSDITAEANASDSRVSGNGWVQFARESGRKLQCASNLRQLGLGVSQYHDAFRCLPWGRVLMFDSRFVGPNSPCTANYVDRSFLVAILPFLDRADEWDSINQSLSVLSAENTTIQQRMPSTYICPSDLLAGRTLGFFDGAGPVAVRRVRLTSYAGNFGLLALTGLPTAFADCRVPEAVLKQIDGVLNDLHPLRCSNVTDGLSQAALAAERLAAPLENIDERGTADSTRRGWWFTGNMGDSLYTATAGPNAFSTGSYLNWSAVMVNSSSNHPGGVHLLRCDGSVTFVGDAVHSWSVLPSGEPVGASIVDGAW